MILGELLAVAMFVAAIAVVLTGFPVAFALGGTAFAFAALGFACDSFDWRLLDIMPSRVFGIMTNETLVAIPLFVLMGTILERSRIAEELLESIGAAFGRLRGGLGFGVVLVGALLAASTGIVGATVTAMGLMSLPTMLRNHYSPRLASGLICASGTLGQLIPPSILLIILGDQLANAYLKAQTSKGNFAADPVTVVDLFAGALLPGLLLAGLYIVYLALVAWLRPGAAPAMAVAARAARSGRWRLLLAMLPPLVLIVLVLGSILAGVATATESAGVGAVAALLLALAKRQLDWARLSEVVVGTLVMTSMIFVILIGASLFSLVFRGLGGEHLVVEALQGLPGEATGAILFTLAVIFVLGFFLDYAEIVLIVIPIVGPAILAFDVDPIWFGILVSLVLQTSFLTPPFGFSLFYLRAVAPAGMRTMEIYRGIIPFVGLQLLMLAFVFLFPEIARLLPEALG